jgi:hypothetical protein
MVAAWRSLAVSQVATCGTAGTLEALRQPAYGLSATPLVAGRFLTGCPFCRAAHP